MDTKFSMISVQKIQDNRYQTRQFLNDEEFDQLIESIRSQGILQPICVRSDGEMYVVMAGHRRFSAAKFIGMAEIPCNILDNIEQSGWAVAFHENVYRKDMTPVEEAHFVVESMEKGPYTAEELSVKIRKSVAWIRDKIQICAWPADVAAAVHAGKISVAAARNLAEIPEESSRGMLVEYAVENGATARITAAWLQGYQANQDLSRPGEISPVSGKEYQSGPAPYAPCLICANMLKMIEMQYMPICPDCNETVVKAVQKQMRGEPV